MEFMRFNVTRTLQTQYEYEFKTLGRALPRYTVNAPNENTDKKNFFIASQKKWYSMLCKFRRTI